MRGKGWWGVGWLRKMTPMAAEKRNLAPRIANRRALHDYAISARIECGMALLGSEVKSLRNGKAQLQEAYAVVEDGQLVLRGCHIEPYDKATLVAYNPLRERKLLVHRREIQRLEGETRARGTTLIPLAIYFKNGLAKIELGVARGRREYDKRQAIRRKEQDREVRRAMSRPS